MKRTINLQQLFPKYDSVRVNFIESKMNDLGINDQVSLSSFICDKTNKEKLKAELGLTSYAINKLMRVGINSLAYNFGVAPSRYKKISVPELYQSNIRGLPSRVDLRNQLTPVKDQGTRGTCTAFALTCLNEHEYYKQYGRFINLSEEFLFYFTKRIERNSYCRALLSNAALALHQFGQCDAGTLPYSRYLPCIRYPNITEQMTNTANQFKRTLQGIPARDFAVWKQVIASQRLIAFAIPVFGSPLNGFFSMPANNARPITRHAMSIVGYDDATRHFIARNSVHKMTSTLEKGYSKIPYEYISTYCIEAYTTT